jgi:arginine:ornithine antiporter/lysine permease
MLFTWFAEEAFTIALKMMNSMMLIPYLLVAAYASTGCTAPSTRSALSSC